MAKKKCIGKRMLRVEHWSNDLKKFKTGTNTNFSIFKIYQ